MHNTTAIPSHYEKWEDYKAGMYRNRLRDEQVQEAVDILENPERFRNVLEDVAKDWPHATAQHLSDVCKNHQPWCGRLACSYELGATIKEVNQAWGFLNWEQREAANRVADRFTFSWRREHFGGQQELPL